MNQSRRSFLKQSGILSAGLIAIPSVGFGQSSWGSLSAHKFGEFPVHQGLTLDHLSYFTVLRKVNSEISYEFVNSKNQSMPFLIVAEHRMKGSEYQLDKIKISDLELGESYRLRILNSKKQILDERFFKALDIHKKMPKIIVASCMNDFFKSASTVMWEKLHAHKPDLTFLIGDTCYADKENNGTPLGFWNRYVETRSRLGIFRNQTLTPILASWDDHDFGQNNGDSSFRERNFMLDLFAAWWLFPQERNYRRNIGVFQEFSAFGQKFYLMDCRFFRTVDTHYGSLQEEMLFDSLDQYDQPSWLMNGSQFFGGYSKGEAFENSQNKNFKQFCQQLSRVKAPVCFVSGDVHFSELMAIEPEVLGYATYELTSSSIHSYTFLQHHNFKKNPRRIKKCATSKHNFLVINIDNSDSKFKFNVASHGDEREIYFQKSLQIVR